MSSTTALKRALESVQQQLDSHVGRYSRIVGSGECPCKDCDRARKFIEEAKHEDG